MLSFDQTFDEQPHWQLLKEMLTQTFATPRRHHKSKPFFDHVLSFTIADDRIWFRNYQVGAAAAQHMDQRATAAMRATVVSMACLVAWCCPTLVPVVSGLWLCCAQAADVTAGAALVPL